MAELDYCCSDEKRHCWAADFFEILALSMDQILLFQASEVQVGLKRKDRLIAVDHGQSQSVERAVNISSESSDKTLAAHNADIVNDNNPRSALQNAASRPGSAICQPCTPNSLLGSSSLETFLKEFARPFSREKATKGRQGTTGHKLKSPRV